MKEKTLKILALLFCITLSIFVVACTSVSPSTEESGSENNSTQQSESTFENEESTTESTTTSESEEGTTESESTDGIVYSIDQTDEFAIVMGYNGIETDIIIADTYQGVSVTSIGERAFYGCDYLTSVVIPKSVTSIGDCVFEECYNLTSVNIPDGVTSIGGGVFIRCGVLTNVKIPESVTSIGDYAFTDCLSLTNIVIPKNVTSIGDYAFSGCESLIEVVNNSPYITVEKGSRDNGYLGYYALSVSNCDDSYVSKLTNDNGYIVYSDGEEKIIVDYVGSEKYLILPSYATKINDYAFYRDNSLTSVIIPDGVRSIGDGAFSGCYRLVEVINKSPAFNVKKGSTFHGRVGCYAVMVANYDDSYETKLSNDNGYIVYTDGEEKIIVNYVGTDKDLVLPSYATKIKDYAFYGCNEITSVEISENVTSIGNFAFYSCRFLASVEIPKSVTSIGDNAFRYCASLISIVIPDSVTSIGDYAISGCKSLTNLVIGGGVTSMGYESFSYCAFLTNVVIGSGVESIGSHAFAGCTSLASVVIPDSVMSIDDMAFYFCGSLTSVVIPASVTRISDGAFQMCTSLANVYYKGTIHDWNKISKGTNNSRLISAMKYFYTETPTTGGNYWHYDENGNIVEW